MEKLFEWYLKEDQRSLNEYHRIYKEFNRLKEKKNELGDFLKQDMELNVWKDKHSRHPDKVAYSTIKNTFDDGYSKDKMELFVMQYYKAYKTVHVKNRGMIGFMEICNIK